MVRRARLALLWLLSWHLDNGNENCELHFCSAQKFLPGQLRRAPVAVYAGSTCGSAHQLEATVTLEHDLAVVAYLAHVGPVLVEAHGTHE